MQNLTINILSDSLGNTAEHVAKAAMAQFGIEEAVEKMCFEKNSFVQSDEELEIALKQIDNQTKSIILYTIVNPDHIQKIESFSKERGIACVDILSPTINAISKASELNPSGEVGMLRKMNSLYFERVECVEFAVKYDDGKDPRGIQLADIVIVGISRTSKTPLSMYLANKSIHVCNIPLVPESAPPIQLFEVPSTKIIGLTNSPQKLEKIRQERLKALGLPEGSPYSDMGRILEEIDFADNVMKKIGCKVIDVADRAIEETAEIIIHYMRKNGTLSHRDY